MPQSAELANQRFLVRDNFIRFVGRSFVILSLRFSGTGTRHVWKHFHGGCFGYNVRRHFIRSGFLFRMEFAIFAITVFASFAFYLLQIK